MKKKTLFTKYQALKEALMIHRETKAEIHLAHQIASKLEPMLPRGWETSFIIGMWRGLCVSFHSPYDENMKKIKSSALDFKLVCSLVEKAAGVKVHKSPWMIDDTLFALKGSAEVFVDKDHKLTISIRHHSPSDCKLEYETKEVRIAKVDDACLGLMENGQ